MCFTPLHPTLCIALVDVWLGCSCSAMETQSNWLCRKLATSAHYAPQHPLTPLRHFMWHTMWHTIRFHFVITALIVDCGIFRSEEISQLDLLHRWHPITVPWWNSLRVTHSFTTVCRNRLHAQVLLYTCGHGRDWNT